MLTVMDGNSFNLLFFLILFYHIDQVSLKNIIELTIFLGFTVMDVRAFGRDEATSGATSGTISAAASLTALVDLSLGS